MRIDNVEQFKDIVKDLCDTYERKNSDYGNAIENGIHDLGYIYSVCQLYNKFMRFKNLIGKGDYEGKVGESLVDTLLDMSVYAIETARILMNDMEYIGEMKRLDEFQNGAVDVCWADWGEEI